MTIESRRRQIQADRREWGEPVSSVPHTGCPPVRENFKATADDHDSLHSLGPLDPTYLQIPIPANAAMISTEGWTPDSLINKSINFHHVHRVSALSSSLPQDINNYEKSGLPLVIQDCHKHPNWSNANFTLDFFASAASSKG